jgi:molybdopterin molybdotransferase
LYWKVAVKPGKPNYLGLPDTKAFSCRLVFGLPGNPVSAMLSYLKLVKPALLRMMGQQMTEPLKLHARLETSLQKKPGRLTWVRGVLKGGKKDISVKPLTGQGSHMLSSMARANCVISFGARETRLEKGQQVEVELMDWTG